MRKVESEVFPLQIFVPISYWADKLKLLCKLESKVWVAAAADEAQNLLLMRYLRVCARGGVRCKKDPPPFFTT